MATQDASHFTRQPSTADVTKSIEQPESFKLKYMPLNAVGATPREILAHAGAQWENIVPSTKDGNDLVLSEASTIDHYLAKHFGLLGDNEYESMLIKSFHSSSSMLQTIFGTAVVWAFPEVKDRMLQDFKNGKLATWIQVHTKHLIDNGDNGHYLGNKLSLADIRTACLIENFAVQPFGEELLEAISKSRSLLKVRETVAKDPKIAAWRAGEQYQKLTAASKAFFANPKK
ncbi:hypothetical protein BGZ83_006636 [Gryganskiella cystojenkinii]|nr:hypothetical protein BGZ83_006636 [Gryganskiella cystojenkinii]